MRKLLALLLLVALPAIAQQQIIIQTRQMIIQSFGVVRINSVAATFNANTRALLDKLVSVPGVERVFSAPFFHEAVIRVNTA